jgi:GntR family transcriptional regulator/MocR family aminotransferase
LKGFYGFSPARQGLLMGFGLIAADDIDPALDRLRDILLQFLPARGAGFYRPD